MPDVPSDPAVEARLRDYLTAELTRAETDFHDVKVVRRPGTRTRRAYGLVFVPVVAVMLVAVFVAPRLADPVANAPGRHSDGRRRPATLDRR